MDFKKTMDKAIKACDENRKRFNSFEEAKKEVQRLKSEGKKAIINEFYDEKGRFYSVMTY